MAGAAAGAGAGAAEHVPTDGCGPQASFGLPVLRIVAKHGTAVAMAAAARCPRVTERVPVHVHTAQCTATVRRDPTWPTEQLGSVVNLYYCGFIAGDIKPRSECAALCRLFRVCSLHVTSSTAAPARTAVPISAPPTSQLYITQRGGPKQAGGVTRRDMLPSPSDRRLSFRRSVRRSALRRSVDAGGGPGLPGPPDLQGRPIRAEPSRAGPSNTNTVQPAVVCAGLYGAPPCQQCSRRPGHRPATAR